MASDFAINASLAWMKALASRSAARASGRIGANICQSCGSPGQT
jgi:hypothetical protein